LSTPKKLINCLAFSWNVAFPVSQGNVVINVISSIIIAVNYYIAVYVGHAPCNLKANFYIGVFNNTVYINIEVLTYRYMKIETNCISKIFSMVQVVFCELVI